jgi:hypothetical protein
LVVHDLRGEEHASMWLGHLVAEEAAAPFDLERGPLFRGRLIRLSDQAYVLLLTQHRLVADEWSQGILINELTDLYATTGDNLADSLPLLGLQYPDYALWQHQQLATEAMQRKVDFWRTHLAGAPELLELPLDHPRPPKQSFTGRHLPISIGAGLTSAIRQLSDRHGVTVYMTLLTAWSAVLAHLSGQDDLVIGALVSGRTHQVQEGLIGLFSNTLPLRIKLDGSVSVSDLLAKVRHTVQMAHDNQDIPFELIVETTQPRHDPSCSPIFQVLFCWQNSERPQLNLPFATVCEQHTRLKLAQFDLTLELGESNECIHGSLNYATALFDNRTMERHRDCLLHTLLAMVHDCSRLAWPTELVS